MSSIVLLKRLLYASYMGMLQTNTNIKLSQLRALVAVAYCGNFGEAALNLGLTQPTVSHAIATLEAELGVVLVSRGRHGAVLTPAGEDILKTAEVALGAISQLEHQANRHRGLEGGRVRVATFRSAAANLLPEVVAQFHRNHTAIEVSIHEHYDYRFVEQDLRDGRADIGITFLPSSPEFETYELLRDAYVAVLPLEDDLPLSPMNWDTLSQRPLIIYPDDNSCTASVRQHFQHFGHRFQPRYQFRETSTILNMVAQGLGMAILPILSTIRLPPGVTLRQLPEPLERIVGAAILAAALQPPAVFAFLEVLQQANWPDMLIKKNPPADGPEEKQLDLRV